ncbi:MAG: hybrid sensor histidine kinase/response regulator [Nitrospirota bacterium]
MIRILIADDSADNRYMLETLLKGNGYEVVTAENGAEALKLARAHPPGLIITDILMPVMDGFALCREWKADERLKRVPFVFYTATYTGPKDEEFALSLGAERFIIKPKRPDEMIALLHEVLDDARTGRLGPREHAQTQDAEYLRGYSETLFRKLEKKMKDLELANQALTAEIAERKRIESELVYRNSLLVTQQDASIDGIMVADGAGTIVSFNKRFVELWGIPNEIVASRSDERAMQIALDKVAEPDRFLDKVKFLYEHRDETSRDLIELKDHRIFDRYSAPVIGEQGRYYGRVWYFRDITEQKKLEKQLQQAQKMEAVGTLAGGIAHDFNNILSAIMGYASLLQKKLEKANEAVSYLDHIVAATKRGAGLTRSLLAFSRKQEIELQPVNINEVVRGFQKMVSRLIGADIEFSVACSDEALVVESDAGHLEHVLMNLITNARDAMPRGGQLMISTSRLSVPADQTELQRGTYAVIAVTDTGTGIDKETQERIFEPFFTTKEAGKGTGLGLAMAYGIIRSHRGCIRVYSEPGKGTTFKIYLPLTGRALPEAPEEDEALLPTGTETVLLVEDDLNVRLVTADILREFGYTVLEAVDGEDAVRVFQRNAGAVQLVLCDLIMPKKNGKEAMDEIRKQRPDVKMVFTSGYTADIIAQKGLIEEETHFLSKPVSTISLIKKVREVLDS